jgi:hypothetical protein
MSLYKTIAEYTKINGAQFFTDIAPNQQPIVIRNFVSHWPLVAAAKQTPNDFVSYIKQFYQGHKTQMVVAPPAANKRFYYNDEMTGVNFLSGEERIDLFLGRLLELIDRDVYPAISMQSTLISEVLPGLTDQLSNDFFTDIAPRLWIGNEGIVNTHYDGSDNLACVAAGRRRFILFPPEQTVNLYPGPLNFTPAGAPTSLANIDAPDFDRYPLFKKALASAYSAELGPGDAIFIPMLWWHHVESLNKVNALVNYWWNSTSAAVPVSPSPIDSLNLALLAMRNLSHTQRQAWRQLFDHYLFHQTVDPKSYIPEHQQHILGELSPEYVRSIKDYFITKLQK